MTDNLNEIRLIIKDFIDKEENKELFFFGLFVDTKLKREMGLCKIPGGEIDLDVIRENFRDFVLRNFSQKQTENALITSAVVFGMLEGLVKLGYAELENTQNAFTNHTMAN